MRKNTRNAKEEQKKLDDFVGASHDDNDSAEN